MLSAIETTPQEHHHEMPAMAQSFAIPVVMHWPSEHAAECAQSAHKRVSAGIALAREALRMLSVIPRQLLTLADCPPGLDTDVSWLDEMGQP